MSEGCRWRCKTPPVGGDGEGGTRETCRRGECVCCFVWRVGEGDVHNDRPKYAELLTEMRTHTLMAVNEGHDETARVAVGLPSATRRRLIESLDSWNFEPHKLPEEELVECTLILFETLFRVEGMLEAVGVTLGEVVHSTLFRYTTDMGVVCRPDIAVCATSSADLPVAELVSQLPACAGCVAGCAHVLAVCRDGTAGVDLARWRGHVAP